MGKVNAGFRPSVVQTMSNLCKLTSYMYNVAEIKVATEKKIYI